MTIEEVVDIAKAGALLGCTEALFTLGESECAFTVNTECCVKQQLVVAWWLTSEDGVMRVLGRLDVGS